MEPKNDAAKELGSSFFNELRKLLKPALATTDMQKESAAQDESYESWWKDLDYEESTDEEKAQIEHYIFTGDWEGDENEDA